MIFLNKDFDKEKLKRMSLAELDILAEEIRGYLIDKVSANGGHLAPNLGVVELTIALHRIFNTPDDKIIWDVGHQAYVHKILTGRFEEFGTIRQFQGLSGFPKRSESSHDCFGAGHSSTSISAAVGFAIARDIKSSNNKVLAVIGDGAMTGGMAYEALNNAGHLDTDMTVILNDNKMSIGKNIGGMAAYLNRVRMAPSYTKKKSDLENLLNKIPAIGSKVAWTAEKLKEVLKYMLVPGQLFKELGFKYFGPVDGHNIAELIDVLEKSKGIEGPKLIHIITKKGKGYLPAEEKPDQFHGIGAFDKETGKPKKTRKNKTYTNVFGETLLDLAETNKKIIAITAAMDLGTGTDKFARKFPDRFFDVGIAEEHAVTMAGAMAAEGFLPVIAIYSTFLQRAYDQMLHDIALQKLPVIFAIDRAGLVGEDGPTHHGVFDISYIRNIPNFVMMAPKDENELKQMLYSASTYKLPTSIRYPRGEGLGVEIDEEYEVIPLGKAEKLVCGSDVAIIAIGNMVEVGAQACKALEEEGISAALINARFIKPLDEELIMREIRDKKLLVTLEENVIKGGFGEEVLELIARNSMKKEVLQIGIDDEFVEHGNAKILRDNYGLNSSDVVKRIREKMNPSGSFAKVINCNRRRVL